LFFTGAYMFVLPYLNRARGTEKINA